MCLNSRGFDVKIAVLFTELDDHSSVDDQDVLAQVEAVSQSIRELGFLPEATPISLDLKSAFARFKEFRPDFVFNLVESLGGVGRFPHFVPTILDFLNIPYSGGSSFCIYQTTDKVLTKKLLLQAGIKTPGWWSPKMSAGPPFPPPYIIKPAWEDASVGIDAGSVINEAGLLQESLQRRMNRYGECFVEAFIPGREFNISMLASAEEPEVLPPAEMLFINFPQGKPEIVDYAAKWDESSFEFVNTVRTFKFSERDAPLLAQLEEISRRCWHLFECRGYVRVDFRVDRVGQPWVLEVNVNPCISPDSGFVAALNSAGYSYTQMVERILRASGLNVNKQ
ncbi:MAG: ATP-grasp domain-containing protein [Calditrichaeota bacterium]|nr:MAG: ATP-grasp domain-containing protein [Calditrichota bacterium]